MLISLPPDLEGGGRVLLIEPEDSVRRGLQLMLQGWRFSVRSFSAAAPALADADAEDAHVLLVAQRLLGSDGGAVLRALRQRGWQGRAILLAESRSSALVADALETGFSAVLEKPVGRLDLLNALAK